MDVRVVLLVAAVAGAVVTSDAGDWKPVTLVLALGVVMLVADGVVVWTRRLRFSAGPLAQVRIMALLGPAPRGGARQALDVAGVVDLPGATDGLATMRQRVEDAGGQLEIATRPDGGTHARDPAGPARRLGGHDFWTAWTFSVQRPELSRASYRIGANGATKPFTGSPTNANGLGLNTRGHSLDVCSITSGTHPP